MKYFFALLSIAISASAIQAQKHDKPFQNVIVILGDDHRAEAIGAYGNKLVKTPNLDKMAARGIRFTNAFANSPVCSASRQSLLTGKYPHATGVSLLTSALPEEQITLADHLLSFGFATAIIGKNHFNNNLNHGFSVKIERKDYLQNLKEHPAKPASDVKGRPTWRPFKDPAAIWLNAEGLSSGLHDEDEAGTFYAKKAIDFIQENKNNRFCLFLGLEEPHSPFNFPVEFAGRHKPEDMPLPKGSDEDNFWIPAIFKDLTDDEKRGIIASYYTSVEFLDKNVGLVLDALEKSGLTETRWLSTWETTATYSTTISDLKNTCSGSQLSERHLLFKRVENSDKTELSSL
jgi:choline-sulfatase